MRDGEVLTGYPGTSSGRNDARRVALLAAPRGGPRGRTGRGQGLLACVARTLCALHRQRWLRPCCPRRPGDHTRKDGLAMGDTDRCLVIEHDNMTGAERRLDNMSEPPWGDTFTRDEAESTVELRKAIITGR